MTLNFQIKNYLKRKKGSDIPAEIFTIKLITDSNGKKFGKSESGALYLEPELTSPYSIYQYFLNVPDSDVKKYLYIFDDRSVKEIDKNEFECLFVSKSNSGQYIKIRVMLFNLYYGNDFYLFSKDEVIKNQFFGDGNMNFLYESAIGDFLAISKNKKNLIEPNDILLKSGHGGISDDESYIPIIII